MSKKVKKIAIKRIMSGVEGVSILTVPASANDAQIRKIIDKWLKAGDKKFISYAVVGDVLSDRYFRDAWSLSENGLVVDFDKAKDVQMRKIRAARDSALKKLDKEIIKVIGQDDKVSVIETKRQALRDLPQNVDFGGIKSTDELKTVWPTELED